MYKLPTQPQLLTKILEDSVKLFIFVMPKILPLVLADVVLSYLFHLVMPDLNSLEYTVIITTMMDSFIYAFLYMLITLVLHTAIFYRIGAMINQFDMGNLEALSQGIKKLGPIFLATGFYTFLVGMGLMAFVIPGAILAISLRFFTPLILFEDATAIDSLQRSHKLVWDNWLRTAIILSIPLSFTMFIGLTFSGLVEELFTTTFAKEQVELLMQLTYLTIDKLLTPFFYAIILLQYYDLKRRTQTPDSGNKYFIA
ncbi:MAG: hypothetical protein DRQ49_07355 [Gammaproteobacteria bacterium]|nr:MAG: hypothetical protein DRQ49_07355 [Gammaproteobacteria bacterium]RKZ41136.1 MAG: hypothetical protein DRQ41_08600 [Gammaproteobacteria bacterium]RKZ74264.1 MAG: hypothetical protein DRQ57_11600 [Gammaproteobacteria bacterium]